MKKSQNAKTAKAPTKRSKSPMNAIQVASISQILAEKLEDVTPIVQFLENFRAMVDPRAQNKSILISIKIPEPLLAAFKFKSAHEKTPYQTMIKKLMAEWVSTP
jgi:predicted DNA binding CopG/RHH family protein